MTSVSYANVAAAGKDFEDMSESHPIDGLDSNRDDSATQIPVDINENNFNDKDSKDVESADTDSYKDVPKEDPETPKKGKVLAPAPVPSKSAWGSTGDSSVSSVDEHKWPTPDKAVPEQTTKTKFVKANKWIPLNAKVVMPSGRNQQYPAKNKRKNKTPKKKEEIIRKEDEELEAEPVEEEDKRSAKNYKRYNKPTPRFYPQFVPSQYQAYRQYKPGNFRRGSGTVPYNGYMPPYVPIPHHPQAMMGPFVPVQIPPPISPTQNPQQALTQQIDYYFSLDNLIRDVFLRRNMGTEGWVELDLILNFKRIKIIVNGIHNAIEAADAEARARELDATILRAVQQCQNVEIGYLNGKEHDTATATEVQLRVRHSFEQWLLPDN